jgi:1-acyl-sn-glycerol-3-phosphate acyltransferase
MTALRSALFMIGATLVTIPFGCLVPLGGLFGYRPGNAVASFYTRILLKWVEWCCGIRYQVDGWENVPKSPTIIMAKHQSAWETLFMETHFPPQCWIIKKELLWLPFVGWSLLAIRCIAIDRSSGHAAKEQIVEQGAQRIARGMWVSIFPEGTRIAPGKRGRYGVGGAYLATKTGTHILPIAHNAGEFWGRYAFNKHPGTVRFVIGAPIDPRGRDAAEVNAQVEEWIEGQMRRLNPERYADA